jgi:predicted outer membrane repeat protein
MRNILSFLIYLLTFNIMNSQSANCLDFDGIDDAAIINSNNSFNCTEFTIESWVKWEGNSVEFITGKGLEQFEIHTSSNNSIRFIPVAGVYLDTGINTFMPNVWNHIACVYNPLNSLAKIYINGVDIPVVNNGSNPISSTITNNILEFSIGKRSNSTLFFNGKLDEFRFWNKSLNQAEIQNKMNCEIPTNETGLIANLHYNQGIDSANNSAITSVLDATSNGNNAILSGFTLNTTESNFISNSPIVSGFSCLGNRYYVNGNIPSSGNGLSWARAFKTIQEAINAPLNSEIWVAQGTYFPTAYPENCVGCDYVEDYTIYLKNNTKLYGGFNGTETQFSQRNVGLNPTIISGERGSETTAVDNFDHLFMAISKSGPCIIDGFQIIKSLAQVNGQFQIDGVIVVRADGAGIYSYNSNLIVQNCLFEDNVSRSNGGSIYTYGGSLKVENSVFNKNRSNGRGSVLYVNASEFYLNNSTFINNISANSKIFIENIPQIPAVITNTILWNDFMEIESNSSTEILNNIIKGYAPGFDFDRNTGDDPLFIDELNYFGDDLLWLTPDDGIRLKPCSPAIDNGLNNSGIPTVDVLKNPRVDVTSIMGSSIVDIGAYEYQNQFDAPVSANQSFCSNATVSDLTASGNGIKWYLQTAPTIVLSASDVLATANYLVSQNIDGCESPKRTVQVTVNTINDTVSENLGALTVTQTGASYQWYQCPDLLISGATSQSYSPSQLGDYKVKVTLNGCESTSSCFTFTTLNTENLEVDSNIMIYPNPGKQLINININDSRILKFVNSLGQLIKTVDVKPFSNNIILINDLAAGIYFVRTENSKTFKLIVKE